MIKKVALLSRYLVKIRVKLWLRYKAIPQPIIENGITLLLILGAAGAAYGCGKLAKIEKTREPVSLIPNAASNKTTDPKDATLAVTKATSTKPQSSKENKATPEERKSGQKEDKAIQKESKAAHVSALLKTTPTPTVVRDTNGTVIGVKSSKHYYFPWCSTIARLKESNAIVFSSIVEAKKAGYAPAKNCKGLQ